MERTSNLTPKSNERDPINSVLSCFIPARMKFFTGIELYIAAVLPLFDFLLVLNITCIGSFYILKIVALKVGGVVVPV